VSCIHTIFSGFTIEFLDTLKKKITDEFHEFPNGPKKIDGAIGARASRGRVETWQKWKNLPLFAIFFEVVWQNH